MGKFVAEFVRIRGELRKAGKGPKSHDFGYKGSPSDKAWPGLRYSEGPVSRNEMSNESLPWFPANT